MAEAACPAEKAKRRIHDTEVPGLSLLITAGGSKTYYLYRFVNGKPLEVKIDTADRITPDKARERARELNGQLVEGRNPAAEKVAVREAATLGNMWETYRARMATTKKPRTLAEDDGLWGRYLEPWSGRRVTEISVELVEKHFARVAGGKLDRTAKDKRGRERPIKGGKTAANRMLALLSGMFSECGQAFGVADVNPCSEVKRSAETACERYLTEEEFPAYWLAVEAEAQNVRDFLKMAILTAPRRSTLITMRWDEINLPFKAWAIPAEKMKGAKALVVPLVPAAVEVLEKRKAAAEEAGKLGEWVFPGEGAASGHLMEPKKAVARVWKAAGVPAVTLHDLRRTTATWMNSTGASEATIAALLGHKYKNVTGIYSKATEETKRTALAKAVEAVMSAIEAYALKVKLV